MKLQKLTAIILSLSIIFSPAISFCADEPTVLTAFPGAEGGGMYSLGARAADDMELYHVTNLNDSGEGSFRDAVSQSGRIIVFDVAGNIMLDSDLIIKSSNLTILGQTSPGEGICIAGESVRLIGCSNVIIRYMRFRMGDNSVSEEDALGIRGSTDVIIDHCSVEWSVDECLSAYENKNFTAQYCIISESLNNSIHAKGAHGYGGIWGGINASFHHNLISTHNARMPRIGSSETVATYNGQPDTDSLIDIRNNVFYNFRSTIGYGGENNTRVNFVNNYYKPSDFTSGSGLRFYKSYGKVGTVLYANGNYMEGRPMFNADNYSLVYAEGLDSEMKKLESISDGVVVDGVLKPNGEYIYDYPVTTVNAQEVYDLVLSGAGASIVRDYTDTRIINDVKNGTYPTGSNGSEGLIDSQDDVGGWNWLFGTADTDSDNDGLPDMWEDENGTDKNDAADALYISANGYTNIENYANGLAEKSYNSLNKEELWQAMKNAESINRECYFEDGLKTIDSAYNACGMVLANKSCTQNDIDSAVNLLNEAIASLENDNRIVLKTSINKGENIDKQYYTAASYDRLLTALSDGKAVLDEEYNEEKIFKAAENIENAIAALEQSNRVRLLQKIEHYADWENDDWTEESFEAFLQTIQSAQDVYNNYYADESQYERCIMEIIEKFNELQPIYTANKIKLDFENIKTGSYSSGTQINEFVLLGGVVESTAEGNVYRNSKYGGGIKKQYNTTLKGIYSIEADFKFSSKDKPAVLIKASNLFSIILSSSSGGENNKGKLTLAGNPFLQVEENKWYSIKAVADMDSRRIDVYVNGRKVVNGRRLNDTDVSAFTFANKLISTDFDFDLYCDNITITQRIYDDDSFILGDADADGNLSASDAAIVLQKSINGSYIMPIENKTDLFVKFTDADADGILTASDAAVILQKVINNSYTMPAEYMETTESITEPTTAEPTTVATTEKPSETTTGEPVPPQQLIFDSLDVNTLSSPYTSGAITLTSTDGEIIEMIDKEHNGYVKAIDGDAVDITVNATSKTKVNVYYKSKTGFIYISDSPYSEPWVGDEIVQSYTLTKPGRVILKNAYIYAICIE